MTRLAVTNIAVLFAALGLSGCPRVDPPPAPTPEAAPTQTPGEPSWDTPLPAVIALSFDDPMATGARDLGDFIDKRLNQYARASLPGTIRFPLRANRRDTVSSIAGTRVNVLAKWLDPITPDASFDAPRFGTGNDFTFFFGDGWNATAGNPPHWNGAGDKGWLWVNHEDLAGIPPGSESPPTDGHRVLSTVLNDVGILSNDIDDAPWKPADVDTYVPWHKKQMGGSWIRVERDERLGWKMVPHADARRYDATSATRLLLTGHRAGSPDHDDAGGELPPGVIAGTFSDCSGTASPWGTLLVGEENTHYYYGDAEPCWTADQQFVPAKGCDPGQNFSPDLSADPTSELGRVTVAGEQHARDLYGFIVDLDPGRDAGEYYGSKEAGYGHKKLGAFGRARRENAAFVVDKNWKLPDGQPIVLYGGDDRRGGRVYKFVSRQPYREGMTRAETRALLDDGMVYAAQLDGLDNATGKTLLDTGEVPSAGKPGKGRWIHLGVDSRDVAPNAAALGRNGTTVGRALKDKRWNQMAGFPTDNEVRAALFTASAKVGIVELNRPEDVEWNPVDPSGTPRLYVAFTKHERRVSLDAGGRLVAPDEHEKDAALRTDLTGGVWVFVESNTETPATSTTFEYYSVWQGSDGKGVFDAACPDNLAIDKNGGLWFTSDGNFQINGSADGIYYVDLNPSRKEGAPGVKQPSFGKAFRIATAPPGAEATGPSFSPDMKTMFLSIQGPGNREFESVWPPRSRPRRSPAKTAEATPSKR